MRQRIFGARETHPFGTGTFRCLIVEDNIDAAEMLQVALEWEGHTVRLAGDGEEAIAAAAAFQPDTIVLDIGLPRMNGYEVARAIRQIPGLRDVVIVAATGYGQDADRHKSQAAGINQHLVKPIKLEALLHAFAVERGPLSNT
jgi:two-component system, sensor histidine kinase